MIKERKRVLYGSRSLLYLGVLVSLKSVEIKGFFVSGLSSKMESVYPNWVLFPRQSQGIDTMSLVFCFLTLRVIGGFCWKSSHKVCLGFVFLFFPPSPSSVQFHSFTKNDLTWEINSEMQCAFKTYRFVSGFFLFF